MNALQYANGPVTSKYGALRAKNGHPEPYNIEYLEIGNGTINPTLHFRVTITMSVSRSLRMLCLPNIPISAPNRKRGSWGDDNPTSDSKESVELLDEHYYRNPAWFARTLTSMIPTTVRVQRICRRVCCYTGLWQYGIA